MIYLLCREFFVQASTVKNHTNATNLSKHLSMISNNLLVFMKHVLAIGRGLFFRLYNSNCIGRFASLLRTPGEIMYTCMSGWQKLRGSTGGTRQAWTYVNFCRELRFVAIYALFFWDLWAKKVPFWVKTVLLGQEVHCYMVYIAYFTELILQIWDYTQKRRIWRENCKYPLDENFHCHFCSRRKAAKLCQPG